MVDSPLVAISYTAGSDDQHVESGQQAYQMFYQSACGNTMEVVKDGASAWAMSQSTSSTIFTDAKNNTGMAAFNYINGSQHEVCSEKLLPH